MNWKLLHSSPKSAAENMRLDEQLLREVSDTPMLHLYEWQQEALTYGYFINPTDYLNPQAVKKYGLDIARRPTGGGLIFHNCDFAFSIIVPSSYPMFSTNTLENYHWVNQLIIRVLKQFNSDLDPQLLPCEEKSTFAGKFCMAHPTIYDVVIKGKKVGGGAQRRTKQGLLHQGSISLGLPQEKYLNEILINQEVGEAMRSKSYLLINSPEQLQDTRKILGELLYQECSSSATSLR